MTEYTYDANNNKMSAKDPNGNITTFLYDTLNRVTQVTLPGGVVNKKMFYDARGNKTREEDERGIATLWEYDALNRVVKQARDMNNNDLIDTAADLITTTAYDNLNCKTSVTDPNGHVTTMVYDGLCRLKTSDRPAAAR